MPPTVVAETMKALQTYRNKGVNYIELECGTRVSVGLEVFGEAYKRLQRTDAARWRRRDVVISLAVRTAGLSLNEQVLSPTHLTESVKEALILTGLEYFDIILLPCPRNDIVSIRTFALAVRDVLEFGDAYTYGLTGDGWTHDKREELFQVVSENSIQYPCVIQVKYSMLFTDMLTSLGAECHHKVAFMTSGPLLDKILSKNGSLQQ